MSTQCVRHLNKLYFCRDMMRDSIYSINKYKLVGTSFVFLVDMGIFYLFSTTGGGTNVY
jgi:hypothetical protein